MTILFKYVLKNLRVFRPQSVKRLGYLRNGGITTVAKKNEAEMPETENGFNLNNFFQGTKEELEKVIWPSRLPPWQGVILGYQNKSHSIDLHIIT